MLVSHRGALSGSSTSTLLRLTSRGMGRRPPNQGKPPILPPSKKVLYHVVNVPWQKPEDVQELLWRRLVYNNAVTSLREEIEAKKAAGLGIEAMKAAEEEELVALIEKNKQRNAEAAKRRAVREAQEWKETEKDILEDIEAALVKQKEVAQKASALVRDVLEQSPSFVTRETLEARIIEALDKPVVYDFAIDRTGRKFYDPLPVKYQEGTPTRQKGRLYEKSLGLQITASPQEDEKVKASSGHS